MRPTRSQQSDQRRGARKAIGAGGGGYLRGTWGMSVWSVRQVQRGPSLLPLPPVPAGGRQVTKAQRQTAEVNIHLLWKPTSTAVWVGNEAILKSLRISENLFFQDTPTMP